MLIGLGVVLGLAGLALLLGLVSVDLYAVGDDRLGLLLLVAGAVVVTVSLLRSGVFSRDPPGS